MAVSAATSPQGDFLLFRAGRYDLCETPISGAGLGSMTEFLARGCRCEALCVNAFWGERYGQIADPFGHRWGLAQQVRDVSREEVARAAAEMFGG